MISSNIYIYILYYIILYTYICIYIYSKCDKQNMSVGQVSDNISCIVNHTDTLYINMNI